MDKKNNFAIITAVLAVIFSVIVSAIVSSRIATVTAEEYAKKHALAGGGREDNVRVLKLAHALPTTHPVHTAMVYMQKEIEKISGGKMKINIFPSEQLGKETVIISKLQRGEIAMGKTSSAALEGFAPIMGLFSMPYLFNDADHYWKVLDGKVGKTLLDSTTSKGLKGLCYYDAGARSFYFKDLMIHKPSDLTGLLVRVQKSPKAATMVRAMKGIPTPMSFGELYSALQSGRVNGAENNPPSFLSSKHCEVCKFYSLDEHAYIPDMLMMSQKVWDSLSDQERAWLQQAADDSSKYERKLWAKATQESLDRLQKEYKVKIGHPDKVPFKQACKGLYEKEKGTEIGKLIDEVKAVK